MKIFSWRMPVLVVGWAVLAAARGLAAGDAPAEIPATGGVAAELRRFVQQNVIAGAVVLVADRDRVLECHAVGYRDLAAKLPMQTDSLFYIASMTKTFTVTGLLMLVDEGKVKLDEPVETYLPEFHGQMLQESAKQPPHKPGHPITVREVLDHTAGLASGSPRSDTLEGYVRELAARPLQFDPGSKYRYSAGPAVAGRIVEAVSGVPYPKFLQQRLLDPLGLKETGFWPGEELAARLALMHKLNPDTKAFEPVHNVPPKPLPMPANIASQFGGSMEAAYTRQFGNPAGGLFSTAADVARFCQMLLGGGTFQGRKYLSPQAFGELSRVQTGDLLVTPTEGYGLCCFVQKETTPGGPSLGSFGHHGARKTQMWIDPQNQLVMVLMVQCWELTHDQQADLYATYRREAIARYAKPAAPAAEKP